jgi:MOSC domain-containing protein YiiM
VGAASSAGRTGSGRVVQINVSRGGVPKLPVPAARIAREGVEGDGQADRRHHGGPERAVSLWALEVIEALRGEGHPVEPGGAGENLTLSGLDWSAVRPGARLRLAGGVELEVTAFAAPCKTIEGCFAAGDFERISDKRHAGSSRVYCRVLHEGRVAPGEAVRLIESVTGAPPAGC